MTSMAEYLANHPAQREKFFSILWKQKKVPEPLCARLRDFIEADWSLREVSPQTSHSDVLKYAYQLATFTLDRHDTQRAARRTRLRSQMALARRSGLSPQETLRLMQRTSQAVAPCYTL